jgi:hypothetical protein
MARDAKSSYVRFSRLTCGAPQAAFTEAILMFYGREFLGAAVLGAASLPPLQPTNAK